MDDRERRLLARFSREALKNIEEAIVHIRGCMRCERVFTIAYEAHVESEGAAREHLGIVPGIKVPFLYPGKIWLIFTNDLLREFRRCEGWPKGI